MIDTCALSEFTKPKRSPSVVRWFSELPVDSEYISVLTLGEIEKGIARLDQSRKRASLERWFAELRDRFVGHVLHVDEAVALEWGRISARADHAGESIPSVDALIGATAIVHGLSVVTRNASDIARTGAPIIDPWEP